MVQQDLNNVLHWSLQNNMLLHEDKFDLITHMANYLSTLYELPHISEISHILHPVALHCIQLTQLKIWESSHLMIYLRVPTHIGTIVSRAKSVASWVLSVFKILHGICPNDLNIQFAPPSRLPIST